MIGWEFPPFNSGGLGVACKGLAEALINRGIGVLFVLPQKAEVASSGVKFYFVPNNPQKIMPPHFFSYYSTSTKNVDNFLSIDNYLFNRVTHYAKNIFQTIKKLDFDLIHAHDWLTFPAAIVIKKRLGKRFIAHVHAIEFDRAGGHFWEGSEIALIEKRGLEEADKIIAVSQYTKDKIVELYHISSEKITVVHNGVTQEEHCANFFWHAPSYFNNKKIILFVGRLTLQKGVDWFLRAAQKVANYDQNVIFIIVGDGDFKGQAIKLAADLGILSRVIFTGFLRGEDLTRVYQMGDLYVLSSVSEPFGIAPLEAIKHNVPVILSKSSGVSEVLRGALKIDFWNTEKMAEKMLAVLNYQVLKKELVEDGKNDLEKITWDKAAEKVEGIYNELL